MMMVVQDLEPRLEKWNHYKDQYQHPYLQVVWL
jgi:hypothetical protein